MKLDSVPLFDRLAGCERVLLAGAGGGFDVFCGLPLYFALRRRGVAVELGDVHRTSRTRGSQLYINPLMSMVFAFELGPLAERVTYLDALEQTETIFDISRVLEAVRREGGHRPRRRIPL